MTATGLRNVMGADGELIPEKYNHAQEEVEVENLQVPSLRIAAVGDDEKAAVMMRRAVMGFRNMMVAMAVLQRYAVGRGSTWACIMEG